MLRSTSRPVASGSLRLGVSFREMGFYMSGIGMISTISIHAPGIICKWGWSLPNIFAAASWDCACTIEYPCSSSLAAPTPLAFSASSFVVLPPRVNSSCRRPSDQLADSAPRYS